MTNKNLYRKQLTGRLHSLGLPKAWVKDVLWPQWWSEELDSSASARYELEILFARQLGLDLASLRDQSAELKLNDAPRARFKTHNNADLSKVKLARAMGARLGALTTEAHRAATPLQERKNTDWSQWSARKIRAVIMESGTSWISLEELLGFCWERGLPVVHACLPEGMKKFDGMALCPAGDPVILTFCSRNSPAWQAFIVAHELGHHVLGHIGKGGEIFDSYTGAEDEEDEEERAANDFAVELLTGSADTSFDYQNDWPDSTTLAAEVTEYAHTIGVHPGAILLNWFHQDHRKRAGSASMH